jgi:hypothetical protein
MNRFIKHAAGAVLEGGLIAVIAVGLIAGTAFAGKPSGGGTTGGSCSVNPNPVAVGSDYDLTGRNLGAGAIVNVLISDSGGTTSWNLQADASGTASVTWHSYWTGTSSVKFLKSARHGSTTVASCTFAVN